MSAADISDFVITPDLEYQRTWHVSGEAISRFASMTNWDYYEAALRFQKVLEAAGEQSSLSLSFLSMAGSLVGKDIQHSLLYIEQSYIKKEQAFQEHHRTIQMLRPAVPLADSHSSMG